MKAVYLLMVILFCRCNSTENKDNIPQSRLAKQDETKFDSLAWLYYAVNYRGDALFYDTIKGQKVAYKPVECEVVLKDSLVRGDTSYYLFSLNKPGLTFLYVDKISYQEGFGIFSNKLYPLTHNILFDYQNNYDSVKAYLASADSGFREYLGTYKGQVSVWLDQEITRRKFVTK